MNAVRGTNPPPSNLRILHVAEVLTGGVATYLNALLPWQIKKYGPGQVALIAPEDQIRQLRDEAKEGLVLAPYVRRNRRPLAWFRLRRAIHAGISSFKPELLHAHSSFAGAICRTSARARALPIVYCAHGWAFDMQSPKPVRALYAGIERALARHTAVIVTITEHESMLARQRGIVGAPLQRIYYGLPDTDSPPPPRLGGDGPLEFLFVGRLDRQKGLDWLLECWPQLPASDFRLTVVGSALHSGNAVQRELPNVHYTGWIDNAMLDGYFDRADAVVMPSRWEGFGLVAAEAMRRGVPVLVSDRGALAEVIGGDEAGKVFSLSSSASFVDLARSLQRDELRRLGRQGRVRFEQLFRSERMNQETDGLYRQILSSAARKSAIPPHKS